MQTKPLLYYCNRNQIRYVRTTEVAVLKRLYYHLNNLDLPERKPSSSSLASSSEAAALVVVHNCYISSCVGIRFRLFGGEGGLVMVWLYSSGQQASEPESGCLEIADEDSFRIPWR